MFAHSCLGLYDECADYLVPKKHNTVDSSTSGSEFLETGVARDLIVAICYKLRMFGVPFD